MKQKRHSSRTFLFILLLAFFTLTAANRGECAPNEGTLIPVRVQLKWFHQFQFAGFYAALEQGYFRQAGLDVKLIEGGPTIDPTLAVTEGGAEFGVGNSTLLIDYSNGVPVVAVSAIFQHSPLVIIARRDDDIQTVKDLEGHTLMGETHAAELITYLKLAGVQLDKVEMVTHTGTMESLAKDHPSGIDAATAYVSTEPFFALKWDIPYQIFSPRDQGIDFYADTLFTSQDFASNHPALVVAMRDALAKGWQYARTHQDEVVSLILRKYHSQQNTDRLSLTFEAQVINTLLDAEIVDIGYMSSSRWRNIGNIFARAGELPANFSLDGFLFEADDLLPAWVYYSLVAASVVLIAGLMIAGYIINLNRKLAGSLEQISDRTAELEAANKKLALLSITDEMTGLVNRRHFDEVIHSEFLRAKRIGRPLALLMIDVDRFKKYNDCYGHLAGDSCLQQLANIFKAHAQRSGDLVARFGGEEFSIIAPNMDRETAITFAENLCREVEKNNMPHIGSEFSIVTISIGVFAGVPDATMEVEALIHDADLALYRAKEAGRNRVISTEGS